MFNCSLPAIPGSEVAGSDLIGHPIELSSLLLKSSSEGVRRLVDSRDSAGSGSGSCDSSACDGGGRSAAACGRRDARVDSQGNSLLIRRQSSYQKERKCSEELLAKKRRSEGRTGAAAAVVVRRVSASRSWLFVC